METLSLRIFNKKIRSRKEFLTEVYNRYGEKLCSYAVHSWKLSEDEAWDLIYKTLYRVMDVLPRYEFENAEKFRSFLFTTFINYIKNHYRDRKDQPAFQVELQDQHAVVAHDEVIAKESSQLTALKAVLEELEDWQRILVLMRSDGRSYAEIAEFVDKPESQLKVYYQRIKERITRRMYENS